MEEIRDDPRDVLALLNSLGFVGITAPQLKAFMKDLKMHRKIKERARQQWKEVTTNKIMTEQERMLDDMLRDIVTVKQTDSVETITESNDSYQQEDPLVRIRVHHVSDFEENKENECECNIPLTLRKRRVCIKTEGVCRKQNWEGESALLNKDKSIGQKRERTKSNKQPKHGQVFTDCPQITYTERKSNSPQKRSLDQTHRAKKAGAPLRPVSAPVLTNEETVIPIERSKSVASGSTGLANTRHASSRYSTHSQAKSFIRPWILQSEAHKIGRAKKCDPVSLYQKYQQEWKQISFPGEDQHTRLRWAVREKMLGIDPNPRPIIKKSPSIMSIRKR